MSSRLNAANHNCYIQIVSHSNASCKHVLLPWLGGFVKVSEVEDELRNNQAILECPDSMVSMKKREIWN